MQQMHGEQTPENGHDLSEHRNTDHEENNQPCDVCDTTLERNYMLRAHRETMHEEDNTLQIQRSTEQGEVPGGSTDRI